jgi:hypothetical protein
MLTAHRSACGSAFLAVSVEACGRATSISDGGKDAGARPNATSCPAGMTRQRRDGFSDKGDAESRSWYISEPALTDAKVFRCPSGDKDIGCRYRGDRMVVHEVATKHAGAPQPGGTAYLTKLRISLILAAASALLCLPTSAVADTTVKAKLVEQNGSGVSGTATLTAIGNGGLKVVIHSQGLVPGQPHAQHIHGSAGGGHHMCPTLKMNDTDGDGVLTNEEATGEYGTIFLALTTRGGATPQDGLAVDRMPVADSKGRLDYERTFSAKMIPDGLLEHLSYLHVVQHGIDVNNNDKYDVAALGVSTFAKSLGVDGVPEEATDPASCGVVEGAGAAKPGRGGVDTGGAPPPDVDAPLAAAGAALLLGSAALLFVRRRARATTTEADDGQTRP